MDFEISEANPACYRVWNDNKDIHLLYYLPHAENRIQTDPGQNWIHIDEDSWVKKGECLLARIQAKAGLARKIHARTCVVARIDKKQALDFMEEHHLQVPLPGKYRFGLFQKGELVSVAVFSSGRKKQDLPENLRSFELLRFCHKQGFLVVGGLSKLIRSFEKSFSPGDIMTYADKDWSDGQSYLKLGFRLAGELPPQEFWVDSRTLQRYTSFDLPHEFASMDPDTRRTNGLHRLYNSGSLKLVKTC